jgi:hypothetical protein
MGSRNSKRKFKDPSTKTLESYKFPQDSKHDILKENAVLKQNTLGEIK